MQPEHIPRGDEQSQRAAAPNAIRLDGPEEMNSVCRRTRRGSVFASRAPACQRTTFPFRNRIRSECFDVVSGRPVLAALSVSTLNSDVGLDSEQNNARRPAPSLCMARNHCAPEVRPATPDIVCAQVRIEALRLGWTGFREGPGGWPHFGLARVFPAWNTITLSILGQTNGRVSSL